MELEGGGLVGAAGGGGDEAGRLCDGGEVGI